MVTGSAHHVAVEFVTAANSEKMLKILWMKIYSYVVSVSTNVSHEFLNVDKLKNLKQF